MKITRLLAPLALVAVVALIAGATVAGESDYHNCGVCKTMMEEPGLMEHLKWEGRPIATGMVSVTKVEPAYEAAYERSHKKMMEAVARLEAGEEMEIQLLGDAVQLPDLMIIGSHCVGMDFLLGEMRQLGYQSRFIPVGSMGGVLAARRGECDLAGTHLMDEASGVYNEHLLTQGLKLVKGYRRGQGFIFRKDDPRFEGFQDSFQERFKEMLSDPELRMINRNRGSGTRVLIDGLLGKHQPQGFLYEAKSHQAVAAAVAQSRADWGVAIRSVAEDQGLGFIPLQDEEYDFIIPESRLQKPAVQELIGLLDEKPIIERLEQMGLIRNPGKDRS